MALRLPGLQPSESKNPAEAGFRKKLKLTDKAASFNHTLGIYSAEIVLCRRLYRILYRNRSPKILLPISSIESPTVWTVLRLGDVSKRVNAV